MKWLFRKDSVWNGLIIGLIIPLAVYGVLLLLYTLMDTLGVFSDVGFADDFRTRTLALISICSNLVLMQVYRKSHFHHETIRGMLIASMILVAIWFWLFGIKILKF
jgi:putative effector of murein hydrolase LrgA (UPF0299 family)